MSYTSKYCNNCGEKIERLERSITDSIHYCDVCKHDFVLRRILPKAFNLLMAILGIFALGSLWRGGEKPPNLTAKNLTVNSSNSNKNATNQMPQTIANTNITSSAQSNRLPAKPPLNPALTTPMPIKPTESAPISSDEAIYFCGAATKKGTPCSRRVRGGGRCWQHKGQSAMLPPEKLLVSR